MRLSNLSLAALAITLLIGGAGCGGSGLTLIKVKGKVTLDGQPLANASLNFVPASKEGRPASGLTETDGSFALGTQTTGDGAVPGEYKVYVRKSDVTTDDSVAPPEEGQSMKQIWDASMKMAKEKRKKKSAEIPKKYSDPSNTILKATVPSSGPLVLDLSSK